MSQLTSRPESGSEIPYTCISPYSSPLIVYKEGGGGADAYQWHIRATLGLDEPLCRHGACYDIVWHAGAGGAAPQKC